MAKTPTSNPDSRETRDLIAFFNKRFEFYGRKLIVTGFTPNSSRDNAGMAADAEQVDQTMRPFADVSYADDLGGREFVFYDELARRQILSVEGNYTGIPISDQAHFSRFAPYQWNYFPAPDDILTSYAQMYCGSFANLPPDYAGPPQSSAARRILGVVVATFSDGTPPVDTQPLRQGLAACGIAPEITQFDGNSQSAPSVVLSMRQANVTSILCLCHTGPLGFQIMPSATNQGYFPEWLVSNYGHQDDDFAASLYPKEQSAHVLGLMSRNKTQPAENMPWVWAVREIDPEYSPSVSLENVNYWNLLLLASGIQMAGPRLTPQAFQDGLFKTSFPNPNCGDSPYWQACVGFARDHTMVDDFAPVWWNQNERSYLVNGQQGAYCYADQGKRYGKARWPKGKTINFFRPPCR